MEKVLFGEGRKAYLHLKIGETTLPSGRWWAGENGTDKIVEKKSWIMQEFVDSD